MYALFELTTSFNLIVIATQRWNNIWPWTVQWRSLKFHTPGLHSCVVSTEVMIKWCCKHIVHTEAGFYWKCWLFRLELALVTVKRWEFAKTHILTVSEARLILVLIKFWRSLSNNLSKVFRKLYLEPVSNLTKQCLKVSSKTLCNCVSSCRNFSLVGGKIFPISDMIETKSLYQRFLVTVSKY